MKTLCTLLSALFIFLLLSGCGFKHWSKRGIEKGWYRSDTTKQDIITPYAKKDTVFNQFYTRDTVYLKENKLTVKYFYNTKDSTVYLSGNCASDTVRVEKVITTIIEGKDSNKWIYLAIIAGLILLIVFIKR